MGVCNLLDPLLVLGTTLRLCLVALSFTAGTIPIAGVSLWGGLPPGAIVGSRCD